MTDAVIGKKVLVDIVEFDRDLRMRLDVNFVGIVRAVTKKTVRVERDSPDDIIEFKASSASLIAAPPGEHHLRSGEPVAQPDLIARWRHFDELPAEEPVTGILFKDVEP